jgi:hypothetical protein
MPAMRLILRRFAPRCFGTTQGTGSGDGTYVTLSKPQRNTNSHTYPRTSVIKPVTNTASVVSKSADSDVIELVDRAGKIDGTEASITVTSAEVDEGQH